MYLHCVVKFQLRKLRCALTRYENAVPQLRNCVALQLNKKVHCGSCAALQKLALQKLKKDNKELKRCLGMFAYYARWIKDYSAKIKPLTEARVSFPFSPKAEQSFKAYEENCCKRT